MLRVVLLLLGASLCTSTLRGPRAVAIVHRHGHRNPIGTYPKDPYVGYTYPGGFGALTQKGSKQLYFHGQRLGLKYGSLVRNNGWYSAENINALASNSERAIMSAQSFLAGFLPIKNPSQYSIPVWWQPAAITSLPANQDHMIIASQPCAKYDQLMANYTRNPPEDIKRFLEARPRFFQDLSENTGQQVADIYSAFIIYNIVYVQRDNNLDLPPWAKTFLEDALPFAESFFNLLTLTDYMQRAKYGALITDILQKFEGNIKGTDPRTIFEYSGHDSTVSGLSRVLGVGHEIPRIQDYGATLVIEVENGTYNIEVNYYDSADDIFPKRLYLPKCGRPCPIAKFRAAFADFLIEPNDQATYAKVCQL